MTEIILKEFTTSEKLTLIQLNKEEVYKSESNDDMFFSVTNALNCLSVTKYFTEEQFSY